MNQSDWMGLAAGLVLSAFIGISCFYYGEESQQQFTFRAAATCGFPGHKGVLKCYKLVEISVD